MRNYGESVKINPNLNLLCIPDHHYRILIIDGSGSGKTNLITNQILTKFIYTSKIHLDKVVITY